MMVKVSQYIYTRIIRSLLHLANHTRPNIICVVGRLNRYIHNPNVSRWSALERVFKYLKGIVDYGLHYSFFSTVIKGFSDVNWIFDSKETKSTTRYVFTLCGGAVCWKSVKQTIIIGSILGIKLVTLDAANSKDEWLQKNLIDVPFVSKSIPPISIHYDSQVTIAMAKSKKKNLKIRHMTIRHKSIRHLISHGIISLDFIKSKKNITDPLTKGLVRQRVIQSSRKMGLKPLN
jgi:hypothetical protein